jgi:hypothetical protein
MGVTENHRLMQIESSEKTPDELRRSVEARVDVVAALGVSCAGKIERDEVPASAEQRYPRSP